MAKKTVEKKVIAKENWVSNFNLVGQAKVNDFTFKIDEKSNNSSYMYSSMNLGVDCGEKYGVVYTNMIGGYDSEATDDKPNMLYVHGKKDDGSDDFENQFRVAWEDRFDDDILETIGDMSFITVGLEKTDKGKTFVKKFLSTYDAISYIQSVIEEGMVINVRGQLKYSLYQDRTQIQKNITSIFLSNIDDSSKYKAVFTQSVLLNKDSASLKNIDKDKGVIFIDAIVLDYLKEYNGIEVKGNYPFRVDFEFPMDFKDEQKCKKIMDKLLKPKKGVTQINFDGKFIEGGATVTATLDDIPEDIKTLIELGVYSEEEALAKCSTNGNREQRMMLLNPHIRIVGDDAIPVMQIFHEQYKDDDLVLDYLADAVQPVPDDFMNEPEDGKSDDDNSSVDNDMSWLENL